MVFILGDPATTNPLPTGQNWTARLEDGQWIGSSKEMGAFTHAHIRRGSVAGKQIVTWIEEA